MDIKITRMKKTDLPEVMELEKESFTWPWTKRMFTEELDRNFSYILLARDGEGVLQGFICFWLMQGEADILNVAVRDKARRKGVGTALAVATFKFGSERGVTSATLEVREKDASAVAFYESLGFVRAGLRKGYYESPRDNAVIMWLYDTSKVIEKSP